MLAKLVEAEPKRAREFYQRMAQYAAEQYHDDDAIKYAARAVELSPKTPNGHQKLGEMYKRRQDVPHAIAEFRLALSQNDRLFPVYFELAELLLSTGQVDEADRLFRRVVRASIDEELGGPRRAHERSRSTSARAPSSSWSASSSRSPSATRRRPSTAASSSSSTAP